MEKTVTPLTGVARVKYMREFTRRINNLNDKPDIVENFKTKLHVSTKPKKNRKNDGKVSVKLEKKDNKQEFTIQRMKFLRQTIETVNQEVNKPVKKDKPIRKFEDYKNKSYQIEKQKLNELYKASMQSLKKDLAKSKEASSTELHTPKAQGDTNLVSDTDNTKNILGDEKIIEITPPIEFDRVPTIDDTTCPVHVLINNKNFVDEEKAEIPSIQSVTTIDQIQTIEDTTCPIHVLVNEETQLLHEEAEIPLSEEPPANQEDSTCPVHILFDDSDLTTRPIHSPIDTSHRDICPLHGWIDNANKSLAWRYKNTPNEATVCPVNIIINTPDDDKYPVIINTPEDQCSIHETKLSKNTPTVPVIQAIVQDHRRHSPKPQPQPLNDKQLQNINYATLVPSNRRSCLRKRFKRHSMKQFCAHCHDLITNVAFCSNKQHLCFECADKHFERVTRARFRDRPMGYKEFKIIGGDTIYNQD